MLHSSGGELLDEEAEKERMLLSSVFGDSDSERETDAKAGFDSPLATTSYTKEFATVHLDRIWERIDAVPGLWLCKGFMSDLGQRHLLAAIEAEGWFTDNVHNQAMRFKDLPRWALELSNLIYNAICSYVLATDLFPFSSADIISDLPLSLEILWRVPLFDQMIVNCYQPGEGIYAHVDLLQFEDGIAIVSLESTCVMHFTPVQVPSLSRNEATYLHDNQAGRTFADLQEHGPQITTKVPILLGPGDLVLISGDARYNWMHEINRNERCQTWNGEKLTQKRRISVTLRRLRQSNQKI